MTQYHETEEYPHIFTYKDNEITEISHIHSSIFQLTTEDGKQEVIDLVEIDSRDAHIILDCYHQQVTTTTRH